MTDLAAHLVGLLEFPFVCWTAQLKIAGQTNPDDSILQRLRSTPVYRCPKFHLEVHVAKQYTHGRLNIVCILVKVGRVRDHNTLESRKDAISTCRPRSGVLPLTLLCGGADLTKDGACERLKHANLDKLGTLKRSNPLHEVWDVFALHPNVETAVGSASLKRTCLEACLAAYIEQARAVENNAVAPG